MGFFDNIKELRLKISEFENVIYGNKQDYLEIYERNLELEREIEQRTRELDIANKRMLTLQNIWDMMNSSEPLQSVLETIVNSLEGELGYIHSDIVKKMEDENGEYLNILAKSKDPIIENMQKVVNLCLTEKRLIYNPKGSLAKAITERRIVKVTDLKNIFRLIFPELTDTIIQNMIDNINISSLIIIPLYIHNKPFGAFLVYSSREDLSDAEKDFLTMFASQIEMAITIADLFEAVKEQAVTDSLTGLYNRRYFEENLKKEVERSLRQKQPFSIIGIDLDYLKQINDKFGHAYGDLAIKTVADILKKNARSIDIAARMGGEEFNVMLPGIESDGAMIAAERMRKAVEECKLDTIGSITASIGVATFLEHSENIDEILDLTDQAMYQSKREGRNRITIAKPITETSWQEIAVNTFIDILSKHHVPIEKNMSKELCSQLQNSAKANEVPKEVLFSVADILAKTYNPMHSNGITKSKVSTAVNLAKCLDLSKEEIDNLRVAMLLYDIGNLMLPLEILQKSEPLTSSERKHIEKHPVIAAREILKPISYVQDIIPIIEHHHENWDGSGYPGHISKEQIPMISQIILIVDAYYALTEKRIYREKLSSKEALEVIKQDAGKKWNEALVNEFIALFEHDIDASLAVDKAKAKN